MYVYLQTLRDQKYFKQNSVIMTALMAHKNDVTINGATIDDLSFIAQCEHDGSLNPWSLPQIRDEYYNSYSKIFVAKKNEHTPVGFIIIKIIFQDIEIVKLGVISQCRRQKIGSKLLDYTLEYSAHIGSEVALHLEVSHNNHAALELYRKRGFKKIALRKQYYRNGDDAVIMQQFLKGHNQKPRGSQ